MPGLDALHDARVKVAWLAGRRVAVLSVALGWVACSAPGEGGGVFGGETLTEVEPADTAPDTSVPDSAPEVALDTALPETVPEVVADTSVPDTTAEVVPDTTPDTTVDTTPADTAPELPEVVSDTCAYHTDCYPERVCARWTTTGELRCSEPCAGSSDCAPGQICSKLPGSVQVGYCQDALAGLADGAACSDDRDCRSGLCANFMCSPLCLDEAHCATPGTTCYPSGDLAIGLITSVCGGNAPGSVALGQACTTDGFGYDSAVCASGHCDLLSFDAPVCAPICKSEADCSPAQECNMVLFAPIERPDAVPYDPAFTQKTHDAVSACYSPLGSGALPEGSPCTSRGDCRSNKCLALLPGSNQTYCTSFCTSDAQCPATMACKLEALTLSSEWLAAAGTQAPGSWSFVRVCKFK